MNRITNLQHLACISKAEQEGLICSLLSPSATDASIFGAKTANLAKAAQFGFVVPTSLAISRLYAKEEFALMAQEILKELSPPIAVRSSAVKEDSATKAFAGVFETHLGIRTTAEFINAFAAVKNSGKTDMVKKYHGEAVSSRHIAVLVQRMVNATRAGVAFSRDPNTGVPNIIIESNYGLGKSVVDGDVTPDSIEYLEDGTYKTIVGRKSIQITLVENGIQTKNTSTEDSQRCSLTCEEIKEIAKLTQKVEHNLGFATDIEWAFDSDGQLWLLQARPITTLLDLEK